MARSAGRIKPWLAGIIFVLATGIARAQAPCSDDQARQWPGGLTLDKAEQAENDRSLHGKPDPAVLAKIDQAVALLKQAFPDLKGISGRYSHKIADSGARSDRFWITVPFFDYYCNHIQRDDPPAPAGKILLGDETGSWIYIDFNTLGWLVNERASLGKEMQTPKGQTIFELPPESGQWHGHPVLSPALHGESSAAVILTPPGRFPFKPLSCGEFLQAREAVEEKYHDQAEVEALRKLGESMTAAELASQAVVREWSAGVRSGRIFAADTQHGERLVTVDHTYFDPSLPKTAVQAIVLYWRWEESDPVKRELNNEFMRNFDVGGLEKLLDR